MRILAFTAIILLLALAFAGSANEKRSCPPLEIVRDMESSDERPLNVQESEAYATVHGVVDESGVLHDVRVMKASSPEAGEWLAAKVAKMEFKPRPPGCGPLAYEVNVNETRANK